MLITITPNPTIDRVYYLPRLIPNTVHRAVKEVATPSGKGIDAAIILHLLGKPTLALGLTAGYTGQVLASLMNDIGVPHDFIAAEGETRTVPVIRDDATGHEYTITAPTLRATAAHLAQLMARLAYHAPSAWGLICAGSLPAGMPADSYARILRHARDLGLTTLLDVGGEALRLGIAGAPTYLKINMAELIALDDTLAQHQLALAQHPTSRTALCAFATALAARLNRLATDAIIISMGKRGALAVAQGEAWYAPALDVPIAVTAGAGDAMDAGIMLAREQGAGWPEALRWGTALAAAAVMHPGTAGCDATQVPHLLQQVQVERIA
ncbi:MAG: hexose kinase [Caldilineaceae bacterium]|nr:hexose kinase [Caldilineaceae bacterium]MCB0143752.1 hexose kinase [Caldilineaceae bacterium]